MIRRRLAAYTAMYIAGISAGFFLLEKNRPLIAALFLMSLGAAVCLLEFVKERPVLIAFMLAGFMIMSFTYIGFERQEAAVITAEDERTEMSGRVLSAQRKDDYTKLIIKNNNGTRVVANLRDEIDIARISGAIITVTGRADELNASDNPGCFDYKIYMRSKGIAYAVKADCYEIIDDGNEIYWRLRRYLINTRETFLSNFDEESSGFIRGLVFGDKSEINEDIQREFNLNSTGHILAVSGLHIGFLYSLLRFLSGKDKSWPASLIIIIIMAVYGEMTEWSASTLRAVIVLGLSLFSVNFKRTFDLLSSLSAAALIILIFRPYMLFNSGFQMSFAAMGGIAFLGKYFCAYLGKAIGTTIAVQIGTIPVIATIYYRVNILSALINIPIIMLSSLLVPLCLLMLFISMLIGFMPDQAVSLVQSLSESLINLNHGLSFNGEFSNTIAGVGAFPVILFYILLVMLSSEWFRVRLIRKDYKVIRKMLYLAFIPFIFLYAAIFNPFCDDEIVFLSVGQGDCTHIRYADKDVLIDGGGSEFVNIGERTLMPYLLSQGASDLDIAMLTHLHKDHYLGISELSEEYKVRSIAMPEDYRESFEKAVRSIVISKETDSKNDNSNISNPIINDEKSNKNKKDDPANNNKNKDNKNGDSARFNNNNTTCGMKTYDNPYETSDSISFNTNQLIYLNGQSEIRLADDVYIEVLWPVHDSRYSSQTAVDINDPNEHNMVYMIHYSGVKAMITGDLLKEDELKLVDYYKGTDKLKCDILKVAHHGSKSSSSEEFMDAASPEIAVIQVGRNNLYGHPHAQTLERLEERGITIYRTDTDGAVGIDVSTKNGRIEVHTMH